jgi:hypothetical protein
LKEHDSRNGMVTVCGISTYLDDFVYEPFDMPSNKKRKS